MLKQSGHVEDRAKERTQLSLKDIKKARSYVKKNRKSFKKGQTYSIVAPGRKGYYIVGDVGEGRKKHVIKTVYGANMNPPGTIIQNALLEQELMKAAEALFSLEKTASAVALSLAELNFEKAASAYAGYSWDEWLQEEEHVKEALLGKIKTTLSGARGFINRKGADVLSKVPGVNAKTLAGSRQQAAKSYSNYAKGLENQAKNMATKRTGTLGPGMQNYEFSAAQIGKQQTRAAQASARAAQQGRMGAQGMKGPAAQAEMNIAKTQQQHANRQLSAAGQETGLKQGVRDSMKNVRTQQKAVLQAEQNLANATTRPAQAQAQAALAEQQKLLANAQKNQQGFKQQLQQRAQIRQTAGSGGPPPPKPTAKPNQTTTTNTTTPTNNVKNTNTTSAADNVQSASGMNPYLAGGLGGAALAGGGYMGYKALTAPPPGQNKMASWYNIKRNSNNHVEALMMYKEASQAMSGGQLLKDFGAGVDPFGTFTTGYAQQAQRQGISEAEHKKKKGLSTAGGLIGGATVVPSTIYGIVEGAKGLAKGKGIGGRLMSGARGFGKGFKQPMEEVYRASKANKTLREAAKSKGGVKLNEAQKKNLEFTLGKASVRDVAANARSQGKGADLAKQLQSAKAIRSGVLDANTAQKLQPQVGEALNTGLAQLGLGGVIGGYGAYSQYDKGRQMEKATQQRIDDAVAKQASVEYRGKTFPGYNQPIASDKKNKKKMVLVKKNGKVKVVHFGQKGYQHNYSKSAKKNYLTRSAGIRNKSGELTKNDPFSPNYWSRKVLWPKRQKADGSAKKD